MQPRFLNSRQSLCEPLAMSLDMTVYTRSSRSRRSVLPSSFGTRGLGQSANHRLYHSHSRLQDNFGINVLGHHGKATRRRVARKKNFS
jgi:hypothetical protein